MEMVDLVTIGPYNEVVDICMVGMCVLCDVYICMFDSMWMSTVKTTVSAGEDDDVYAVDDEVTLCMGLPVQQKL